MASIGLRLKAIAVAAGAAILVAALGGTVTQTGPWYEQLAKPAWTPPDWLFAPAWTVIYGLTAWAGVTGWLAAGNRGRRDWVVILFALNGALNVLWSLLFFGLQRPDWAVIEVVLLWASVLLLIVYLWPIARRASLLLIPYLVWVGFAGALNLAVVRLNPGG